MVISKIIPTETNEKGEEILVLRKDTHGRLIIKKQDFVSRFGETITHDNFINHPNCTPAWKDVFDEWKEKGLIE